LDQWVNHRFDHPLPHELQITGSSGLTLLNDPSECTVMSSPPEFRFDLIDARTGFPFIFDAQEPISILDLIARTAAALHNQITAPSEM